MGKNQSSSNVGAIAISVILTLIIVGAGGYFGLPLLYPNLTADLDEYEEDDGMLLQIQNIESRTEAYLFDYNTGNYVLIPEMSTSISISKDSRISVTFSAIGFLTLATGFMNHTIFDIKISVVGVAERTGVVRYYEQQARTSYIQISQFIYLNLITDSLSSGTYEIRVEWRSRWDAVGTQTLSIGYSAVNHTRSLVVCEYKE